MKKYITFISITVSSTLLRTSIIVLHKKKKTKLKCFPQIENPTVGFWLINILSYFNQEVSFLKIQTKTIVHKNIYKMINHLRNSRLLSDILNVASQLLKGIIVIPTFY